MLKLGELPRGIIGHGTVIRESYEKEHYDAAKAAEGQKVNAIDVQFDRLINYEQEKFISQEELIAKCGAQHWSPQGSGIEIKQEVIPTLKELWDTVSCDQNLYGFKEIVSFWSDYAGKHYAAPERAGDQVEYMTEMKKRGQDARQKFISFAQKIVSQIPRLEYVSCSNWINQGQVVEQNLWIELKNPEWVEYPQSVSLSISKHDDSFPGDGYYLSIRADARDMSCKQADYVDTMVQGIPAEQEFHDIFRRSQCQSIIVSDGAGV